MKWKRYKCAKDLLKGDKVVFRNDLCAGSKYGNLTLFSGKMFDITQKKYKVFDYIEENIILKDTEFIYSTEMVDWDKTTLANWEGKQFQIGECSVYIFEARGRYYLNNDGRRNEEVYEQFGLNKSDVYNDDSLEGAFPEQPDLSKFLDAVDMLHDLSEKEVSKEEDDEDGWSKSYERLGDVVAIGKHEKTPHSIGRVSSKKTLLLNTVGFHESSSYIGDYGHKYKKPTEKELQHFLVCEYLGKYVDPEDIRNKLLNSVEEDIKHLMHHEIEYVSAKGVRNNHCFSEKPEFFGGLDIGFGCGSGMIMSKDGDKPLKLVDIKKVEEEGKREEVECVNPQNIEEGDLVLFGEEIHIVKSVTNSVASIWSGSPVEAPSVVACVDLILHMKAKDVDYCGYQFGDILYTKAYNACICLFKGSEVESTAVFFDGSYGDDFEVNINHCEVKEFASEEMETYLLGKVEGKVDTDYAHYLYDYHGISLDVSIEYTEELRNGDFKDISHLKIEKPEETIVYNVSDKVIQSRLDEDEIPIRRSYVKRK